jgi:hypothetical protein
MDVLHVKAAEVKRMKVFQGVSESLSDFSMRGEMAAENAVASREMIRTARK